MASSSRMRTTTSSSTRRLVCPSCSAKHRDSRPRRLDKFEGRWFQAEENSADATGFLPSARPRRWCRRSRCYQLTAQPAEGKAPHPAKVKQRREETRVQKQAAWSRPTHRFQFPLGSSHGRYNFSSSGGCSRSPYRCLSLAICSGCFALSLQRRNSGIRRRLATPLRKGRCACRLRRVGEIPSIT